MEGSHLVKLALDVNSCKSTHVWTLEVRIQNHFLKINLGDENHYSLGQKCTKSFSGLVKK